MAELFLAKQVGMEGFEKVVAIKRILAHLAYDEEFINMFRDEARIVAKLSHPNIVQIYDLGKSDDTYFIAMEYIPGRNLSSIAKRARMKEARIPPEYISRCVAQACEGLYYAHTRKDIDGRPMRIVHRDVSPQNVIVSFSGTVKLVDFGIAKAATKIAHTRAGVLKGKYAYMSPEQIRGEEIDARSDLFAVGIVLYELLAGRRPFEKENSIQTLKAIVQDRHRDIREYNAEVPEELSRIIDKALEKDSGKRFQDAQEVQVALEDFVSASPNRCNNITISNWVQDLFAEEISKERGGTMVFKGVGEVILPDVDPSGDDIDVAEAPPEVEASSSAAGPEPQPELEAIPLARGRGGGSVDARPPIPAPSNSLIESMGSWEDSKSERRSLIEEQVLERNRAVSTTGGGWDDDATVHAVEGGEAPSGRSDLLEEESIDRPLAEQGYDDSRTEFAPPHPDAEETIGPPGEELAEPPHEQPAAGATEASDGDDELWDEATLGLDRSAESPTISPEGPVIVAAPAQPEATSDVEESWGDLSGSFDAEATIGANPDLWDDKTSSNDAYNVSDEFPSPVVHDFEVSGISDAPNLDDDEGPGHETEDGNDATIAVKGIGSDEVEVDDASDEFDADATMAGLGFAPEPSDAGWANDATIAGFEDEGKTGSGEDEDEIEVPMEGDDPNDEPALPDGVDLSRNVDVDSATIAGVTSDFIEAGLGAPGHTYEKDDSLGFELEVEAAPPRPVGAIKLSKIPAMPTGGRIKEKFDKGSGRSDSSDIAFGAISEDVTEGEVDAKPLPPPKLPEKKKPEKKDPEPVSALDFEFEDDHDERELPSAVRSRSAASPKEMVASAQEEYSALVAPKAIQPMSIQRPDPAMAIGSTNVPPAALSLADMLVNPSARAAMAVPEIIRGPSAAGSRSASMLGRQIREVAHGASDRPPDLAPKVARPVEPDPDLISAPLVQEIVHQEPARSGRSRVLMGLLIAVSVVCLATLSYFLIDRLLPSSQQLTIRTTPDGAVVHVDEKRQEGKTPLTIDGLEPSKTYQIRLELEGFETIQRPVRLPPNRPLIWQIPLKPKPTVKPSG
jgi:serine/threonine protein kinase